jgi:hypothetical protein
MRLLISKLHQRTWKESLKGIIRSHKSKDMQCDSQEKEALTQTDWGPKALTFPTPLMEAVVLLLNDMNIIWFGNRDGYQYT